jgi:mono/diheme cytochrome c family protein
VKRSVCFLFCVLLCGCHTDMRDQPRYEALEASTFFADGQSARPVVEGTVARGQLNEDDAFYRGREGKDFVSKLPIEVNAELLDRGQDRFEIYCAVCHGLAGDGDGMIVRRGLKRPPSFHSERLRNAPAGHFFDVITHGFGVMPRYAVQLEPRDRWAITAYVRALQRSQNAKLDDVPQDQRARLEEMP